MRPVRGALFTISCLAAALAPAGAGAGGAGPGAVSPSSQGVAAGDFNGDGHADAAFGVPRESVGSVMGAGAVNVLYGSAKGLTAAGNQLWTQETSGMKGSAESFDRFGSALAAGDFNGDGFGDLAVGVPGQKVGNQVYAGAVAVIFGSHSGLRVAGNQLLHEGSSGGGGAPHEEAIFGSALAAGDLGKGAATDLVVGAPVDFVDDGGTVHPGAGSVSSFYGGPSGIRPSGGQLFTEQNDGVGHGPADYDYYGQAVLAADMGHDGHADLIIGVPYDDLGATNQGSLHILFGSKTGVTTVGGVRFSQDTPGVPDQGEQEDLFGSSLAAANLGRDSHTDLAVGVPGETVGLADHAGAVNVFYGSPTGLQGKGSQFWTQESPGILDSSEDFDRFGFAVAAADFGKSRHADLAISAVCETESGQNCSGAVNVLYGSPTGLTAKGNQYWSQDTPGVQDANEANDSFGSSLWAGNFGKSRQRDLAIGVGGESLGAATYAGAANVLYGSPGGLAVAGNQFWSQDSPNVKDKAELSDQFAGPRFD